MAYDIETKCIHLENQEATCDKSGAISFPIYQVATFAGWGWETVPDIITADSRIQPESR